MSPRPKSTGWKIIRFSRKSIGSFTIYVDGREVYAKEIADALAADLQPLARSGLITRLSTYETDPANNPQPPKHPGD